MKIRDVMTASPRVCRPDDSLETATAAMWEGDIGFLPVVDDEGRVVAVVTDRDVCMCAYTRGARLAELAVSDCMSEVVYPCRPGQSAEHALERMAEHRVRRIPVLDEEDRPVGVVSILDVARSSMQTHKGYAELARTILAIGRPHDEVAGRARGRLS